MLRNRFHAVLAWGQSRSLPCRCPLLDRPRGRTQPQASRNRVASPLPDMAIGGAESPGHDHRMSSAEDCPHCAHFHSEVFPELQAQYIDTGKVRYVYREFPLNEQALAGAVAARCLDPSRFFAFTGLLFRETGGLGFQGRCPDAAEGVREAGWYVWGRVRQMR